MKVSRLDRDTVARWVPGWRTDDVESVKLLTRGALNDSWLVTVSGDRYVLKRRTTEAPAPGIEPARELAILGQVSEAGLGPLVHHADPEHGLLVTRYAEGDVLEEPALGDPEVLARICKALKELHELQAPAGVADIEDIVTGYLEVLPGLAANDRSQSAALEVTLRGVFTEWRAGPEASCICHNDLLHSNIVDGAGVLFIDWEYASVGDPMFDLAVLALHHGFEERISRHLLKTYFGATDARLEQRFAQSRIIARLVFFLWVLACRAQIDPALFPEQGSSDALVVKLQELTARYPLVRSL